MTFGRITKTKVEAYAVSTPRGSEETVNMAESKSGQYGISFDDLDHINTVRYTIDIEVESYFVHTIAN